MRKREYEALAQALSMTKPPAESWAMTWQWETDCNAVADALAFDDVGFNRKEFLDLCECGHEV